VDSNQEKSMEEKIMELKMMFRTASKGELTAINQEMEDLASENPEEFFKAMLEAAKATVIEAEGFRSK